MQRALSVESCGETEFGVGASWVLPAVPPLSWGQGLLRVGITGWGCIGDVSLSCFFGLVSYQVGCLHGPVFTPCQQKTMNYLLNNL